MCECTRRECWTLVAQHPGGARACCARAAFTLRALASSARWTSRVARALTASTHAAWSFLAFAQRFSIFSLVGEAGGVERRSTRLGGTGLGAVFSSNAAMVRAIGFEMLVMVTVAVMCDGVSDNEWTGRFASAR